MNHTLKEWVAAAGDGSIAQAALAAQAERPGMTEERAVKIMRDRFTVMREAAASGLRPEAHSLSGLTGGNAARLRTLCESGRTLGGPLIGKAEAYALAVAECNACMGKIVAAPTAGACGILPGALLALLEDGRITEENAVEALFTAAAVGESIAFQAGVAGAEGGCQEEIGTAAAMTAAALCGLSGGSARQCADAAGFALMNLLGLVCDPAGGLVEVPCVYRNVGAVGIAFTAADLALAGIDCPISPDEVIQAMKEVGDALPSSLRETGEGGCAACASMRLKFGRPDPSGY